jgi:transposase
VVSRATGQVVLRVVPHAGASVLTGFVVGATEAGATVYTDEWGGYDRLFGILRRGGKVFAQMIADCGQATLVPIIEWKVAPSSVVYSDSWAGYDTLSAEGYEHERVNHDEELVADGGRHINGIENFWSQAKRHLRKFNGGPKESFPLFLQEWVWRFNTGTPREQLQSPRKMLRRRMIS